MAEKIEDGGPAFPREDYQASDAPGQRGMSIRDYFAGQALIGWAHKNDPEAPYEPDEIADWAYAYADAMLQARKGDKL